MTRYALLSAALLLAACDTPTAPRTPATAETLSAQVIRNVHFESQAFAINDCNGDFIQVDAKFHILTAVTFDAAGGYHVTLHDNISGKGTNRQPAPNTSSPRRTTTNTPSAMAPTNSRSLSTST